jgi:succinate dehydrogenase / fumarate reductase flavoprotein subunit/L-aspartate oxidase
MMMPPNIPHEDAIKRYRPGANPAMRSDDTPDDELLKRYHPDHGPNARVALTVGINRGEPCQPDLARYLQANALIDDVDIAGAQVMTTDVLIIGGGGGGCAAALTAAKKGARVILATKLRLGDSNTVMAEGGIQAAIGEDDSPQLHFEDTLRAGHFCGKPELVAQMVMDGPDVIRWLIQLGMMFDQEDGQLMGGNLARKKPGGASAARILSYRDYTGLEMMRVLREAVELEPGIEVWNRCPTVELLSDERGRCAGAVIYNLDWRSFVLVRARAVILATGGAGRLHFNSFATSNHYGATADGLVLAYRIGARLRELDSFQYHPTGIAYPSHLAGGLISEAARSAGAMLLNGEGERFVDELKPRDVVASAILRECALGRGVERNFRIGVFLDTPTLEMKNPGILARQLVTVSHLARKCGLDAAKEPFLVYPTLHYQNGGVEIDKDGATSVPGLYSVGEVTGGIHGRNRLMGNALLDILSMGRRAGNKATSMEGSITTIRAGIDHVHAWQRELMATGLPLDVKSPQLFPSYANFDLKADAGLRSGSHARMIGGVR